MTTLSIAQYIATVRRIAPQLNTQANIWPYPQAHQSHIAIWAGDVGNTIPHEAIHIPLINSDSPGTLIRIAPGAMTPSEAARKALTG